MQIQNFVSLYVKIVVWVVLLLIVIFNRPLVIIKSTERGVIYRFGAVGDKLLWEGLHLVLPIRDRVEKINIVPVKIDIDIPVNEMWAITKDNQTIGAELSVFYRYSEDQVLNIAKNYWYDILMNKIKKDVQESFKQTIGLYTIFDIAQLQEEIRKKTIESVISKIGEYPIKIDDVKISNYDWSEAFDQQIAKTMEIAQQTKQQEQELRKIEISAQQRVKEAEANKQAEALNADAMKLKGEGIQAYNEAITSNPKNMELEIRLKELEIEKIRVSNWNGVMVPTQVWTSTPISFTPLSQ